MMINRSTSLEIYHYPLIDHPLVPDTRSYSNIGQHMTDDLHITGAQVGLIAWAGPGSAPASNNRAMSVWYSEGKRERWAGNSGVNWSDQPVDRSIKWQIHQWRNQSIGVVQTCVASFSSHATGRVPREKLVFDYYRIRRHGDRAANQSNDLSIKLITSDALRNARPWLPLHLGKWLSGVY